MRKNELHFLVLLFKGKILNEKLDRAVLRNVLARQNEL